KLAGGTCIVARDDENLRDTRISRKPCEKVIECRKRFDTTSDDVRHGLHAVVAKAARQRDGVVKRRARNVSYIYLRSGADNSLKLLSVLRLGHCRFDRIVVEKILNGTLAYLTAARPSLISMYVPQGSVITVTASAIAPALAIGFAGLLNVAPEF